MSKKNFINYKIACEHQGLTLEQYLKTILKISGRKLQKLTRTKGIFINNKPAFLKRVLQTNDNINIKIIQDQDYGVLPQPGIISILYEDNNIIVLDKPPFQLVHPTIHTTENTLANFLANYFKESKETIKIRPLHRLDRNTSGCIIFAKNDHSQNLYTKQLQEKILQRKYWALTSGVPPQNFGIINQSIAKDPTSPNRRIVSAKGEQAITNYQVLQTFDNKYSLVALDLETGRTHQIRVHLKHLNCPIIGDSMYHTKSSLINRQALHAYSISFLDIDTGEKKTITTQLPLDIKNAIEKITSIKKL